MTHVSLQIMVHVHNNVKRIFIDVIIVFIVIVRTYSFVNEHECIISATAEILYN